MKSRRKSIIRKPRKSKSIKRRNSSRRNSTRRNSTRRSSTRRSSKMKMNTVSNLKNNTKEPFIEIKKAMVLNRLQDTVNKDCFNGHPEMYYKRLDYYVPLLGFKKADEVYHNCIQKAFSNPKFNEEDKKNILRKVYKRYDINRTEKEYKEFIDAEYDFYKNVLPELKHVPNFSF